MYVDQYPTMQHQDYFVSKSIIKWYWQSDFRNSDSKEKWELENFSQLFDHKSHGYQKENREDCHIQIMKNCLANLLFLLRPEIVKDWPDLTAPIHVFTQHVFRLCKHWVYEHWSYCILNTGPANRSSKPNLFVSISFGCERIGEQWHCYLITDIVWNIRTALECYKTPRVAMRLHVLSSC